MTEQSTTQQPSADESFVPLPNQPWPFEFCEVTTTVDTVGDGARLISALHHAGLSTGGNLIAQVSAFAWDESWGRPPSHLEAGLACVDELRLVSIIRAADTDAVTALLRKLHPHKTPLIQLIPVAVSAEFADWYFKELQSKRKSLSAKSGPPTVH